MHEDEDDAVPSWWSDDPDEGGLGFCACGNPEALVDVIRDYLRLLRDKWDSKWFADGDIKAFVEGMGDRAHWSRFEAWFLQRREHYDLDNDDLFMLVAYIADRLGFTEHGLSIFGAWLTDEGKDEIAERQP